MPFKTARTECIFLYVKNMNAYVLVFKAFNCPNMQNPTSITKSFLRMCLEFYYVNSSYLFICLTVFVPSTLSLFNDFLLLRREAHLSCHRHTQYTWLHPRPDDCLFVLDSLVRTQVLEHEPLKVYLDTHHMRILVLSQSSWYKGSQSYYQELEITQFCQRLYCSKAYSGCQTWTILSVCMPFLEDT